MSLDWSSTSIEHARDAQARHGWSDEELLDRLVSALRGGAIPDIARRRDHLAREYDALPAATSVTARIEHLAGVLPPLYGPWASQFLADLLAHVHDQRSPSRPAVPARPGPTVRAAGDPWTSWRRGVPIMALTFLAMATYAGLRVWLG